MPITDLVPWRKRSPLKEEEGSPLEVFRRDMNRLFDEFFSGFGWGRFGDLAPFGERWGAFSPRVDVVESEEEIKISAELPGLDAQDIQLTVSNDVLTISGEKKEEKEQEGKNYYRMERSYGSFRRSVPLPGGVDADQAEAVFKKGVLTVLLPKVEARDRTKIAIKSG